MGFDTIRNGIANRLKGLGYQESGEPFDFGNAPSTEYGNTFILNALSGENDEGEGGESETIIDRFYDVQTWQIKIAFDRSAQNDIIERDDLHRKKDLILADLDNPSNWTSFARTLKYISWTLQEFDNYYVLIINLKITDTYTY